MAETPAHGHIFLSYSRDDRRIMEPLRDYLRSRGIEVWTDEHLTPGTPSWEFAIEESLRDVGGLVVLMSPRSNSETSYVRKEVTGALDNQKPIFPVLVDGDENSSIPLSLKGYQYVDIRGREQKSIDEAYLRLAEAIAKEMRLELKVAQAPSIDVHVGGDIHGDLQVAGRDVVSQPAAAPERRVIGRPPELELHPSLAIKLSVRPQSVDKGGKATWTVTLRNDGDDDLLHVVVSRGKTLLGGRAPLDDPFDLAAGKGRRFSFSTTQQRTRTEKVMVTGRASNGQSVRDEASAKVQVLPATANPLRGGINPLWIGGGVAAVAVLVGIMALTGVFGEGASPAVEMATSGEEAFAEEVAAPEGVVEEEEPSPAATEGAEPTSEPEPTEEPTATPEPTNEPVEVAELSGQVELPLYTENSGRIEILPDGTIKVIRMSALLPEVVGAGSNQPNADILRGYLSFDTMSLPQEAVVDQATIFFDPGCGATGNPFVDHGSLLFLSYPYGNMDEIADASFSPDDSDLIAEFPSSCPGGVKIDVTKALQDQQDSREFQIVMAFEDEEGRNNERDFIILGRPNSLVVQVSYHMPPDSEVTVAEVPPQDPAGGGLCPSPALPVGVIVLGALGRRFGVRRTNQSWFRGLASIQTRSKL